MVDKVPTIIDLIIAAQIVVDNAKYWSDEYKWEMKHVEPRYIEHLEQILSHFHTDTTKKLRLVLRNTQYDPDYTIKLVKEFKEFLEKQKEEGLCS